MRKPGRPKATDIRSGKDRMFSFRLKTQDYNKLDRLASYYGLSKTDMLLQLIDMEFQYVKHKK